MTKQTTVIPFDIKGGHKVLSSDINHLRELVEELREVANEAGMDLSTIMGDFCYSVESRYQTFHDLDQDNWEVVHK